ncbi:MAG: LysR family transcriptional regulator [Verrucomicrobiota bacterium JB025]|nr:LysR family transcriptional regulator [Verrucomicrobiota bacterium JB025]
MSKANDSAFKLDADLITLRVLVAVVEEGGFSAAAKRVHRTQSAVSLQIAKLEERLNTKLLERTSRSVAVTPAGETFLSYARRILELADEAVLAVTSPDDATLLRVGVAEYLAPQHLHTLLARFRRAHPNCELSLVLGACSEILEKLNRGDMDLVFAGPDADGGQLLWEEPLVWTGTSGSNDAPLDLVLMPSPCHYRQLAFAELTKAGRSWKMAIEANSVQAVQSAIRAGLGVSVLPLSAVLDDMPVIENSLPKLPKTSVLSYVPPDSAHPYAQRFVDFLLAGLAPGTPHPIAAQSASARPD